MPRISAEREEATRRRILEAAEKVFAERGFHQASIDDVVRASGLSVGAIYTYFHGKDELIRAACLEAINETIDAVLDDLRSVGSVRQKLDRAIDAWFAGFAADPGAAAFLVQAWSAAPTVPAIRDTLLRRRERLTTVASMLIREGVEAGEFRADLDIEALARGFTVLLDGQIIEALERSRPSDAHEANGVAADSRRRIEAFVALLHAPSKP